jgi:peptidoglycan/LPS O-acetylase OafA/YrhL
VVLAAFFVLFVVNEHDVFGAGRAKLFVGQLKFHFMAVGALWAWMIHRWRDRVLALAIFRYRPLQLLLAALLAEHYFVGWLGRSAYVAEVLQLTLYGWLIVEVGVNPRNLLRFNRRGLEYLGTISYGIYMLHMPVVYATAELFRRTSWWRGHAWLYLASFYVLAVTATIGAAALSYRFFERPFLRLKDRLGTSEAPGPPEPLRLPTASANALS